MAELKTAETKPVAGCCSSAQQENCCEPEAKDDCCGSEHEAGTCGCSVAELSRPVQPARAKDGSGRCDAGPQGVSRDE